MAYPSDLVRTKNWGTETLTDSDLEGQFDLIIAWVDAFADETSGHKHDGSGNEGPKINAIDGLKVTSQAQGDILYADSSSSFARLAKGTAGQSLVMNSGATAPEWSGYTVPTGVIVLWSGAISAIPSGWVICDGTNSTPDLTDKFVIHADADSGGTNDVGATGGSHTHTHNIAMTQAFTSGTTTTKYLAYRDTSGNFASESGTGTPPYYALAYIMKT